jgi:hypothetical protein
MWNGPGTGGRRLTAAGRSLTGVLNAVTVEGVTLADSAPRAGHHARYAGREWVCLGAGQPAGEPREMMKKGEIHR